MADEQPEPPMLPLREAAVATGRQPEALRSLVRRGRLKSRRSNDGRLLVEVPTGLTTGPDPAMTGDVAGLTETVADLRDELAELRTALGRAEAERDAARAVAEAERAALRELIAELRVELAHRRLPWWRRVIGPPSRSG